MSLNLENIFLHDSMNKTYCMNTEKSEMKRSPECTKGQLIHIRVFDNPFIKEPPHREFL